MRDVPYFLMIILRMMISSTSDADDIQRVAHEGLADGHAGEGRGCGFRWLEHPQLAITCGPNVYPLRRIRRTGRFIH